MLEILAPSQHFKDICALQRAQKARMKEAGRLRLETSEERAPTGRGAPRQAGADGPLGRGARGLSQRALHRNGALRDGRGALDQKGHKMTPIC